MTPEDKVKAWNSRVGLNQAVVITKDSGLSFITVTGSLAFLNSAGTPTIFIGGVAGYYALERVTTAMEAPSGTCRICGCTQNRACRVLNGPCSWSDTDMTLCSACIGKALPPMPVRCLKDVES